MQTKNVGVDGTEMCVSWAVGLLCHSCHHTKPVDICGWFVIERGIYKYPGKASISCKVLISGGTSGSFRALFILKSYDVWHWWVPYWWWKCQSDPNSSTFRRYRFCLCVANLISPIFFPSKEEVY